MTISLRSSMPISFLKAKAIVCVFHTIAVVSTVLRLSYRKYTCKLWWDDMWAFLGLIFIVPFWISYMVFDLIPSTKPRLVLLWRLAHVIMFTLVLWFARLSVAVTIVRILTKGMFRKYAKLASGVFVLICTALIIQKFTRCGALQNLAYCKNPKWTATLELSTDVVADVWLVCSPAYMLYKTNLQPSHRRLIIAIFACGLLTTITSIVHCSYIYRRKPFESGVSGHIQAATSLIVCNLLVLITYLYRVFHRGRNLAEISETESPGISTRTGDIPNESGISREESFANNTFTDISFSDGSATSAQTTDKTACVITMPLRSYPYPQRAPTCRTM